MKPVYLKIVRTILTIQHTFVRRMHVYRIIFSLFSLSFLFGTTFAQELPIRGKVIDSSTGAPIPFASIAIGDFQRGTSSNINGEFLVKTDSLPAKLLFTHISYHPKEVLVENTGYLEISLTPGEILLEELVIEDKEKGEYAYNLLLQALDKAYRHCRDWKYGLAFYRQTSQNAGDYSELYEIFFDTRFSSLGIVNWAVQEGRYAMKTGPEVNDYVFNKNFTLLSRLVTMYQPQTDKFVMPVNKDVRQLYDVSIRGLQKVGGRKAATVAFTPREDLNIPALEGEILIDIDSHEILKLQGIYRTDHLDIIGLNNPLGSWENHVLEIEAAYKSSNEDLVLDYITLTQRFDYYINGVYQHPVETRSLLTFYEYYEPEKFKRLGGRLLRYGRRDRDMLDRIGYNKRFWEANPIVLRTPVEEEIIASFESNNAFGSIYLNDREQVQLEKDDLDQDPFIQQIITGLKKSKLPSSGEKVYLHTDRPFYASGETLWFNAFVVNLATHVPSNISGVLYVDLISPEGNIVQNKRLKIYDAYAQGNLDLGDDYPTGIYRLRAYTNWMKNYEDEFFFEKELNIYHADDEFKAERSRLKEKDDFEIRFLPEGGHLVNGITSQVAFKTLNQQGAAIDIKGKVIDPSGQQVAELITRHDGMGNFFFVPKINESYVAVVTRNRQEKTFPLPAPLMSGYVLSVNNLKNRNIQVMVQASPDLNESEFFLIGQTRGILYHREKSRIRNGSAVINIPKSKLPDGIFHITLFDQAHQPRCERLVFINNEQNVLTSLETENEILRARDKVKLSFELTDHFDRGVMNTRFSVAVTDADHLMKQPADGNIKTNLLLTSDLKGRINDPGFYFIGDDRNTQIALDLVMLTHGWRRFTWKEIFNGKFSETPHSHEYGITLTGKAFQKGTRRPLKYSYINFMSINPQFHGYWSTLTDQEGSFKLQNINIPDTLSVIPISLDDKGKPRSVDIQFDPLKTYEAEQKASQQVAPPINQEVLKYLNRHNERAEILEAYNFSDQIILEEVEIVGDRYRNNIYGEPDDVIEITDELRFYQDIFQIIQGRVAGVQVTGQGLNTSIRIRGVGSVSLTNEPLFVIDGMPISSMNPPSSPMPGDTASSAGAGPGGSDNYDVNSLLLSLNPQDIDRIEILKSGASAAAYGIRGANGVILIYTRMGSDSYDDRDNRERQNIQLPGMSYIKEFYVPAYDVPSEENIMPDKRTTIYWDPDVRTNNLGRADISFFNSDEARTLQVEIQGVSDFGEIIYSTYLVGRDINK